MKRLFSALLASRPNGSGRVAGGMLTIDTGESFYLFAGGTTRAVLPFVILAMPAAFRREMSVVEKQLLSTVLIILPEWLRLPDDQSPKMARHRQTKK